MTPRFVLGAALALLTSAAAAQNLPTADDITVTGRKEADRKAAQAYVSAIAVRSETQLARFHQPVCPVVLGMPRPYSALIEKRIRADAVAAGVPVAKKVRCEANLIVVFADDGAGVVKDIRKTLPGWLSGLTPVEIERLMEPGPTRAWSVTSLRNADGQGLRNQPEKPGDSLSTMPMLRVMSASIIKQPTRQDMEASFVMIDTAPTMGLSLRQIADYAAMRGLASTRPPASGSEGMSTILAIFDPAATDKARELTLADTAYLRALYRSDGTAAAVNEKSDIARRIAKGK